MKVAIVNQAYLVRYHQAEVTLRVVEFSSMQVAGALFAGA